MTVAESRAPKSKEAARTTTGVAHEAAPYRYQVAGIRLSSAEPLDGLERERDSQAPTWHVTASRRLPTPGRQHRARLIRQPGHGLILDWPRRATFRIDPVERRLTYRQAPAASPEAFRDILFGPVMSFLSILEGRDPLHGAALRFGDGAACFLGAPGAGKSTIAAACLLAGHPVIVDDLLVIRWRRHCAWVLPGHPEVRLWPASGRRLLPDFNRLPLVVPTASKRRLDPRTSPGGFAGGPVPLTVCYELHRSTGCAQPMIEPLNAREAFLALARNLYNASLLSPEILHRQFRHLGALARRIPVRRLLIPKATTDPRRLPALIARDISRLVRSECRGA